MTFPPGQLEPKRLRRWAQQAVTALAGEQTAAGCWRGELASSALATATACAALCLAGRAGMANAHDDAAVAAGIEWLVADQNGDGGWGDAPGCRSNIATSLLALAALRITGADRRYRSVVSAARQYVARSGGLAALRARYGTDRTFVVPIMTMLAIAGEVAWDELPALPFELGILPHRLLRGLQIGVVSYALPALIAIGYCGASRNAGRLRRMSWPVVVPLALRRLRRIQPVSGGYLEAVPLTAFVCMSLMAVGRCHDPVVTGGLQFLRRLQRSDGSWPVDADLACWLTSLTLHVLERAVRGGLDPAPADTAAARRWLLACQHRQPHPYTGTAAGGWGWTDLPGSVPDADDTAAALLAVRPSADRPQVRFAAQRAIRWLLTLQNRDGGWPTFCRGWGWLPFDQSAPDLTAHALRALYAWRGVFRSGHMARRMDRAMGRGLDYLLKTQRDDGSFVPLWFGNEQHPEQQNPLYGTARVLLALELLAQQARTAEPAARAAERALRWLTSCQHDDGGWGGGPGLAATVEETGLAVTALAACRNGPREPLLRGLAWLGQRLEEGQWLRPAPIGLYFAKLWYFERLYPMIFGTQALVDGWLAVRQQATATVVGQGGSEVEASSGCA